MAPSENVKFNATPRRKIAILDRMKAVALLLAATLAASAQTQQPSATPTYGQQREQAMAPALKALNEKRFADALVLFESMPPQFAHDGRVLLFESRAAHLSGDDVKALSALKASLSQERPDRPIWGLHMEIVALYAANGDWQAFDTERARIREAVAKQPGIVAQVPEYLIEELHHDGKVIQVLEYPALYGRFHTRYRFIFPQDAAGWRPFIDCESDDIDQVAFAKKHADLAAKGDRSFSLDSYPHANAHATLSFFDDGEPTYDEVRALVLKGASPIATTVVNQK